MSDERFYILGLSAPVSPDTWAALVAADPSLEAVDHITALHPVSQEVIRVPRPHSARWATGPAELRVLFVSGKRGRISVGVHYADEGGMTSTALREPDPRILDKLAEIARLCGADVECLEWPPVRLTLLACPAPGVTSEALLEALKPVLEASAIDEARARIDDIVTAVNKGDEYLLPWPANNYATRRLRDLGVRFEASPWPDDEEDSVSPAS
jgi:hypothetical protein